MPRLAILLTLASGLSFAACGGSGSYELRWTIGCGDADPATCPPQGIKGCSAVGIDSVEVVARRGEDRKTKVFPCFAPDEGPVGRGPGLDAGSWTLTAFGVSAARVRITAAPGVPAQIPEAGLVEVEVDLPVPPQCSDGMDNDGDGLVDLLDPDCSGPDDVDESS